MEEKVYNIKSKAYKGGILGMFLFGFFFTILQFISADSAEVPFILFAMMCFVLSTIFSYLYKSNKHCSYTLSNFGLTDRTNIMGNNVGFVAWENIKEMAVTSLNTFDYIGINVKNSTGFLASQKSEGTKNKLRNNLSNTGYMILIPLESLDGDKKKIYEDTRLYWLANRNTSFEDFKIKKPKEMPDDLDFSDHSQNKNQNSNY